MKQPAVIDASQRRLTGFFSQSVKETASAKSPTLERPTTSFRTPTRSSSPQKPTSNPVDRPLQSHKAEVSFHSTKKRPRPKETSSQDEYHGDNHCVSISRRSAKSPRISPKSVMDHRSQDSSIPSLQIAAKEDQDAQLTASSSNKKEVSKSPLRDSTRSPSAQIATSFTSASTRPPSSQRIVKDGETIAIRNSDDESSDDSVLDANEILGFSTQLPKSSSPLTELSSHSPPSPVELDDRANIQVERIKGHCMKAWWTEKSKKKIKFSLATLVERAKRDGEIKAQLDATMEQIREIDKERESSRRLEEQTLEDLIRTHGSEEGRERFIEALSRTEALQHTENWHFFDYNLFDRTDVSGEAELESLAILFPPEIVPPSDANAWVYAMTSGMCLSIVKARGLSREASEVLFWVAVRDKRRDVRDAALEMLHHADGQIHVTDHVAKFLGTLGALDSSLDSNVPIQPLSRPTSARPKVSQSFLYIRNLLQMVSTCAGMWSTHDKEEVLLVLLRLGVDDMLVSEVSHQRPLIQAIELLVDTLHFDDISYLRRLFAQTIEGSFRLRILDALPTHSQEACLLRRRLAMAWFFENPSCLSASPRPESSVELEGKAKAQPLVYIGQILKHFKEHPNIFKINRETDYPALKSATRLLSIGLGDGDPDITSPNDAIAFNADVDRLADALRSIYGDIIDSGASHASRVETKDWLDSFCSRLLYSVRTKPRPRKDILGRVLQDHDPRFGQRSLDYMLARKPKPDVEGQEEVTKVKIQADARAATTTVTSIRSTINNAMR